VGQEKLNRVDESVVKAMGAFGGGIAGSGRVCGALLGGVAFISSLYSRGNLEEKEDPRTWRLSRKLNSRFEELTKPYGGVNCENIARTDWKDPKAAKEFYSNPESRRKICIQVVGEAAQALGEILDEEVAK